MLRALENTSIPSKSVDSLSFGRILRAPETGCFEIVRRFHMFAVIRTGGKQYKVAPNDVIVVERLAGDSGAAIEVSDVLIVGDGANIIVGKPVVEGAKVAAQVIDQSRNPKITVLKFKRRKKYRRTAGHQQDVTVLRITEISAPGIKTAKAVLKKAAKPVDTPNDEKKALATETAAKKSPAERVGAKKAAQKQSAAKNSETISSDKKAAKPKTLKKKEL